MTLEEYNRRLSGVISDLESGAHGDVMVQMASNAIALVKKRVQEKGIGMDGQRYRDYTESYKKMKQKAGKYKGFVDFSFTNRMWNNIRLVSPREELDSGVAVIKSSGENQDKLNWNTDLRGEILALSNEEKELIGRLYNDGILRIWRRNGL